MNPRCASSSKIPRHDSGAGLLKSNVRAAKQTFGPNLVLSTITQLKSLTLDFRFSINAGEYVPAQNGAEFCHVSTLRQLAAETVEFAGTAFAQACNGRLPATEGG